MKVNVLLYYNYYYICLKLLSQVLRRPWTAGPVGCRQLLLQAGARDQGPFGPLPRQKYPGLYQFILRTTHSSTVAPLWSIDHRHVCIWILYWGFILLTISSYLFSFSVTISLFSQGFQQKWYCMIYKTWWKKERWLSLSCKA